MGNKVIRSVESFEDFLGHTVKVGDFVVYATVSGRSPVQKFAKVEQIDLVQPEYLGFIYDRETKESRLRTEEEAQSVRVGVRELSNGRGFTRFDTNVWDWDAPVGQKLQRNARPARVTFPMKENIVLVRSAEEQERIDNPPMDVFQAAVRAERLRGR
jgi:hypothetical protein